VRWVLPILVVACATQTDPVGPGARRSCTALEGKTFASLTQGECGLGQNGPTSCTWHLTFTAKDDATTAYAWQHSDVEESGDVSCAGTGVDDLTQMIARGTYDAVSQHLVWDQVTYAP
jgi:hypothetical protein